MYRKKHQHRWDLVTIPLQLFDIPTFIQFLENFGHLEKNIVGRREEGSEETWA
jgi:hypothetical protein